MEFVTNYHSPSSTLEDGGVVNSSIPRHFNNLIFFILCFCKICGLFLSSSYKTFFNFKEAWTWLELTFGEIIKHFCIAGLFLLIYKLFRLKNLQKQPRSDLPRFTLKILIFNFCSTGISVLAGKEVWKAVPGGEGR